MNFSVLLFRLYLSNFICFRLIYNLCTSYTNFILVYSEIIWRGEKRKKNYLVSR